MAKPKTVFFCQSCGFESAKWLGRCSSCSEWNTFVEEKFTKPQASTARSNLAGNGGGKTKAVTLDDPDSETQPTERIPTGISELDRVLGGGLVPDSFILLGGDPGIGKSTLVLQIAKALSNLKILYVSGEESISQIRARAKRLGLMDCPHLILAGDTLLENVLEHVEEQKPQLLIMDSIQTFSTGDLESAPGSVGQVREVAARLMTLAKSRGIAVILIGHVTKEGNIAGPKVVEHMVDTVLYFEGDTGLNYRMLRAVKNRFGSVRELGVFEMTSTGLAEVTNPSSLFLSQRDTPVSGTATGVCLEGTRPIFVEVQALVSRSNLAMPRRNPVGLELARLGMLTAVLERHLGVGLYDRDVFVNVAGGYRIQEPACDLAVAAAIWSSLEGIALAQDQIFVGELSLTGELRSVSQLEGRVEEALRLGFRRVIVPKSGLERVRKIKGIEVVAISRIAEIRSLFASGSRAPQPRASGASRNDARPPSAEA